MFNNPHWLEVATASNVLATHQEWKRWMEEIPWIQWPSEWEVKAVPPFAGAIVRYFVRKPGSEHRVSIYLDCYSALGSYGSLSDNVPYWEVYPVNGDTARCEMSHTAELIRIIKEGLSCLKSAPL